MTARYSHHKVSITLSPTQSTGWSLLYPYTADLLCWQLCWPLAPHSSDVLSGVSTPLDVQAWAKVLAAHPDRAFARYICDGLSSGFRVGFQHGSPLWSTTVNIPSVCQHPNVVHDYLRDELARGRMLSPFSSSEGLPPLQINTFGVIPKGHNTGKWRLITDFSFPRGRSVNYGIDSALSSLFYISVDNMAAAAEQLGLGALLAIADIEPAYRLIPVHPQDQPLLAVKLDSKIFIDLMLPFGLQSSTKIFNAVADALNWYLQQKGIPLSYHYLDDFVIIGPPRSPQCANSLAILNKECDHLKVPMAAHKCEGPTTCLSVLGIIIDTVAGELRLSADKLEHLQTLLRHWGSKATCSRKELESLIGLLNHACKVVRSSRFFLQRMLDLLHALPPTQPIIRLNTSFRSDLAWWTAFIAQWNGISFLSPPSRLPETVITTDASGSWGCGALHAHR